MTNDWVSLSAKRLRGWPWPAESYGLSSLYGDDGWCRLCAIPLHDQTGPLTLERRNVTVSGAWIPNWQYNALCLEQSVAAAVSDKFNLPVRAVSWPRGKSMDAVQVVIPSVGPNWFDPAELTRLGLARGEGYAGAECPECGKWKWIPPGAGVWPRVSAHPSWDFSIEEVRWAE